jgi:ABC-type nitrate/sulfonate/bicarbonate transport system substrate-binding protein
VSPGLRRARAALAGLALLGCLGGSLAGGLAGADTALEKPRLLVALAGHTKSYLPLYLAQERTARNESLEIELVAFAGGSQAAAALVSGSVDVALASLDTLVSTTGAHPHVRAFYGGFNHADLEWFAAPGIAAWEGLRGRTIAISAPGSLTDFLTRHVLRRRGLEGEVRLVSAGNPAVRWQALRAGRVDAAILQGSQKLQAQAQGFIRLGLQSSEIAPEWPTNVMFARQDLLATSPATVRALLRAHVRALRLARSDRALGAAVLARWLKYTAPEAEHAWKEAVAGFDERGRLPAGIMPLFWSIAVSAGEVTAPWPESRFLDRQLIDTFDEWTPR